MRHSTTTELGHRSRKMDTSHNVTHNSLSDLLTLRCRRRLSLASLKIAEEASDDRQAAIAAHSYFFTVCLFPPPGWAITWPCILATIPYYLATASTTKTSIALQLRGATARETSTWSPVFWGLTHGVKIDLMASVIKQCKIGYIGRDKSLWSAKVQYLYYSTLFYMFHT